MDYARENIARLARTVIMAALVVAGVAALAPDEAKAETTCQENNPECVYSYDEWYFFEGSGAVAANTGATATFTFEGKK
ncbi:MAG: hypothetical protein ACRDSJ_03730, partial [Rubrobacteraceae bacterium]